MSMYYYGDEKPECTSPWARPISEAYEPPYQKQPIERRDSKLKPKNTPDSENTFLRAMLPECMLD